MAFCSRLEDGLLTCFGIPKICKSLSKATFSDTIPPLFDKRDIREALSSGCGHEVMILPCDQSQAGGLRQSKLSAVRLLVFPVIPGIGKAYLRNIML
jgi:hypothetical protein